MADEKHLYWANTAPGEQIAARRKHLGMLPCFTRRHNAAAAHHSFSYLAKPGLSPALAETAAAATCGPAVSEAPIPSPRFLPGHRSGSQTRCGTRQDR